MKKGFLKSSIRTVLTLLLAIFLVCGMMGITAHGAEKPEVYVQLGHQNFIEGFAMSADGKYIATGSDDYTVKLWDVATGMALQTFFGHAAKIKGVDLSFDGKLIASVDEQGVIKLWDTTTGREMKSMTIPGNPWLIGFLSFSPDAGTISSADGNGTLTIWDVSTGQPLKIVKYVKNTIKYPPGGRYVLTHPPSLGQDFLVEVSSGREVVNFNYSLSGFREFYFSQNGRYGLMKKGDWNFELRDMVENRNIASWHWDVKDKENYITNIALSPDGKRAVVARSKSMMMFDAMNGRELMTFRDEIGTRVTFSPDGQFILSTGFYNQFHNATLWDASTGRILRSFESRPLSRVYSATLNRNSSQMITNGSNAPTVLWDVEKGKPISIYKDYKGAYGFRGDDKYIYLTTKDKKSEFWDIAANKRIKMFPDNRIAWSGDGRYVAEFISLRHIKVTEFPTGKEILNYKERSGDIVLFDLTKDNRHLFILVDHTTAKRIDLETGVVEEVTWQKSKEQFDAYRYSPDGKFLAVLFWHADNKGKTLKLLNIAEGREIQSYKVGMYVSMSTACDFSPDSRQILFVSPNPNNQLIIADTSTGAVFKTLTGRNGIFEFGFSPQGNRIVSSGSDGITLWDTATGKSLINFGGHESGNVDQISMSHDEKQVLSIGSDRTTRLWDAATGKEQAKFLSFTDGEWIVITPEGYFNASPNGAKNINVRIGNKVYGIDQFYTKFYRPELVQLALAGKELPQGETLGDIMSNKPAPAIRILSPASGSAIDKNSTTLSIRISDNGGGVGNIIIYLNGSQVANETRGVIVKGKGPANEKTVSFTIPLTEGQNEIRVIAFNQENSMESNPALTSIISRAVMQKPNLYALVVGINEYKNKSISLNYAVTDAKAFAETLKKTAAPLFERIEVKLLTMPAATTKGAITKAFEELRLKIKPNDLFVFYNASHGIVDVVEGEEQYFLLTSNVLLLSSRHIGKDAMSQKELAQLIGNIPAQKKVVILDTCNAGKGGREIQVALLQQTRGLTDSTAIKLLQRAIGSAVFSASSDTQLALEGYKGHGLFTYVLLEGLNGKADIKKDGYITVLNLADYVEENVTKLSEEVFKRQQTPTIQTGANFPIGKMR